MMFFVDTLGVLFKNIKFSWQEIPTKIKYYYHNAEAVVQRCSAEKLFFEISQNSQENTGARVSILIKFQAWPATLLKKRFWRGCFPVNFAKVLKTPFL